MPTLIPPTFLKKARRFASFSPRIAKRSAVKVLFSIAISVVCHPVRLVREGIDAEEKIVCFEQRHDTNEERLPSAPASNADKKTAAVSSLSTTVRGQRIQKRWQIKKRFAGTWYDQIGQPQFFQTFSHAPL
jgi:hypothetical protein